MENLNEFAIHNLSERSVTDLLLESEKASREGNKDFAYQLSLQATRVDPESIDAWLLRLALAPSFEERVVCVNRLNELAPNHRDWHNLGYFTEKELLERDPFLAYLDETDDVYRVRNGSNLPISIRKKRAAVDSSPSAQSGRLRAAYGWLVLAFIGLLSAGIGTFIFAPLAGVLAIRAGQRSRSRADWVNSVIVLTMAIFLFLIGLIFLFLFGLHWFG